MIRKSYFSLLLVAIVMAMAMIAVPILLASESAKGALRSSRVLTPVNENQLVTLGGHVAPWATSANDLGAAPDSMKVELYIVLKRSDAQESALQTMLAEQQNPKSGNYRKWLTPEEYGTRFGISDADLAKVSTWLTSHGLVIDKVANGNNVIRFSGTHGQLRQALHTTLHQYRVGNELHYANAANPMIPAALAPVIVGFHGLNDMKPKPMHTTPKLATRKKGDTDWRVLDATPVNGGPGIKPEYEWQYDNKAWHLLGPGDFATIYGVQPVYDTFDGTGQTIAIIAATEIRTKDVDDFRAAFGLPTPTKLNIIHDGPSPGIDSNYEMETDLDVEWAGAVAKNATIDLVVSNDLMGSMYYVVDNNLAPVMSVSYGLCELYMQIGGNAFISELYAQAASQGITVLVASGDQAAASCSYGAEYSYQGLSVSGLASTPYNVAVGGTDFPVNVLGDPSIYWGANNAPDQHSAKSYVPEAPWNDSCASSEVLAALRLTQQFPRDTTNEQLCNDPAAQQYFLNVVGGSGGVSNCIDTDSYSASNCTAGYPQPAWQAGVPGVAADSRRHLPDVSFFSGDGLWHTALMFCTSDSTPNGVCFGDDMQYSIGGGTSFATPAFAGIVALLNQKTNSWLGNINYTLYDLAAKQFNDPTKEDACQVGDTTTATSSNCIFHDITQGNIRVACWNGSTDNPPNGVCTPASSSDSYGILSGYDAGVGYDMASGLGSLNVSNLLSSWPTSLAATQTTLSLTTASSAAYGVPLAGNGTITVTSAFGTPTGTAALMYKDASGNTHGGWAPTDLANGTGNALLNLIAPAGVINLYARYGGDGVYAASVSAEQAVNITPAAITLTLSAGSGTLGPRQSTQLTATIKSTSVGDYPSGTVIFKNATTGAVIDTVAVSGYQDNQSGYVYAMAATQIGPSVLTHGDNQLTATFSGDTNYVGATGSASTQYTGGFSIAASSTSLTLSPGATSGNTLVFTVTPLSPGVTYAASSLNFLCPGTLPAGVTCEFSAPTASPDGSVYSTLTVFLSSPLAQNSHAPLLPMRHGIPMYLALMIGGGVFFIVPRKRSAMTALGLVLVLVGGFSIGCGGSGHKITSAAATTTVTLNASNTTPALNAPVTLNAALSNSAATGTVTFFDGTKSLGSTPVSNGAASLNTSSLPVGARSITASYSGDSTYPAAVSSAVAVDVCFTSTITAQAVDTVTGDHVEKSVTLTIK